MGWGRFYNATSIIYAKRIEEELLEAGIITQPLEDEILTELASELDNSSSYNLVRDHFEAIKSILEKSAQIDELSAMGAFKIGEVIFPEQFSNNYHFPRYRTNGYKFGFEVTKFKEDEDGHELYGGIYFQYGYPISLKQQINLDIYATPGLDVEPQRIYLRHFITTLSYCYEITDRISYLIEYDYNFDKWRDGITNQSRQSFWNGLNFYIEDDLYFRINYGFYQNQDNEDGLKETMTNNELRFDFGYDLY
jgi:hypothetical protein